MAKSEVAQEEHPKNIIEVISGTMDAVTGYASSKGMSTLEASLVLILNELRCIHWHFDQMMVTPKEEKKGGE